VVLGWCRYQGGASIDHEDAAHVVFIRLHARLHTLEDHTRFRAFLYGITRRVVSEYRRSAWWRRWVPGASLERVDPAASPERQAQRAQQALQIEVVLEHLPHIFREVLVLCDVQGRTMAEASELVGVPMNTVKTRLFRGRARFRKEARRRGVALDPGLEEAAHHA
jgi:RNA polymerase sigma-70 factor (ECF subfamily)